VIVDYRVYVATLAALICALVVGFAIGSAAGRYGALDRAQAELVGRLEAEFDRLRQVERDLRQEGADLRQRLTVSERFAAAAASCLVEGSLEPGRVVVAGIGLTTTRVEDDTVGVICGVLERAGVSPLVMPPRAVDDLVTRGLAPERAPLPHWREIVGAIILDDGSPGPGRTELLNLARRLHRHGLPVVVGLYGEQPTDIVAAWRRSGLTLVHDAAAPWGCVGLVRALTAPGEYDWEGGRGPDWGLLHRETPAPAGARREVGSH